jgi:chitinase
MIGFGKIASARIRSFVVAPLCGTLLVCGCGNGAASSSNAERDSTESSARDGGDPPGEGDRDDQLKVPRVVGYLPLYRIAGNPALHLDTLTHLNLAFAFPNKQGKVDFDADASAIRRIVMEAHESKVQVLAAIGGEIGGQPCSDQLARGVEPFVDSLIELVEKYDLDGIDIDIEGDAIDAGTYGPMMQALAKRLEQLSPQKLLTAAVAEYRKERYGGLGAADFLNVMSYDQCGGWSEHACEHSTLAQAQVDLDYWSNLQDLDQNGVRRTIGRDNIVLGVPFFGRCWGEKCPQRTKADDGTFNKTVNLSYAQILEYCANATFSGCSPSADVLSSGDEVSGYYVTLNSSRTIENKATLSKNYGGIMIWELGQDDANAPLFSGIADTLPKRSSDSGT